MYGDFKDKGSFKQLQENNLAFAQSLNINLNWSLTQTNEWKYKYNASN